MLSSMRIIARLQAIAGAVLGHLFHHLKKTCDPLPFLVLDLFLANQTKLHVSHDMILVLTVGIKVIALSSASDEYAVW